MNISNLIHRLFDDDSSLNDTEDRRIHDMHSRICFKYKQNENEIIEIDDIVDCLDCYLKLCFSTDFAF